MVPFSFLFYLYVQIMFFSVTVVFPGVRALFSERHVRGEGLGASEALGEQSHFVREDAKRFGQDGEVSNAFCGIGQDPPLKLSSSAPLDFLVSEMHAFSCFVGGKSWGTKLHETSWCQFLGVGMF